MQIIKAQGKYIMQRVSTTALLDKRVFNSFQLRGCKQLQ